MNSKRGNPISNAPNARAICAHALSPVLAGKRSLSATLKTALDRVAPQDKGLVQELCLGTLRVYPKLALVSNKLLAKPLKNKDSDIAALIAIGLYQLEYMRTPDHAAIDQTVEASKALNKPWASKLINGVLRNYAREKEKVAHSLNGSMSYRFAHPQWLIDSIRKDWPTRWEQILEANNQRPPVTLRVNRNVRTRDDYMESLTHYLSTLENAPTATLCQHSHSGITLSGSCDITQLPGFASGEFSVQDQAAQMAAQLLDVPADASAPVRVLDACCAPGGKASHICELGTPVDLTCVDSDESRMVRVEENFARLGHSARLITADVNDTESWWDGELFERILLDAPCSATGVIRRHPDIKLLRRPSDISALAKLQQQMLENLWPTLAPGGMLVYATCSVLKNENECTVQTFVKRTPDAKHIALNNESTTTANASCIFTMGEERPFGRQLFPTADEHDGFYYARISKQH